MNFTTLLEMINASEAREDDPEFQSPVDLMFERLEEKDPEHFAVRQYKKFLLSAGDVSELFGCHPVTISKWKHDFGLNTITFQNKMYIPKQALLDFISSPQFKKLIPGETELWKLINPGRTGKRR